MTLAVAAQMIVSFQSARLGWDYIWVFLTYPLLVLELPTVALVLWSLLGFHYRTRIPSGSRRFRMGPSIATLRALASQTNCPNCGAVLDSKRISDDKTFKCDFCGGSGSLRFVKSENAKRG
jgi:predicted RNA-binding Zn-ribbon protein involved in translation (DUF1610 family)